MEKYKWTIKYRDVLILYAIRVSVKHLFGVHTDICQEPTIDNITSEWEPHQEPLLLTCETLKSAWRFPDVNPLRRTISFSFGFWTFMELIIFGRSGETLTNFCRARIFISLDDFFSLPKNFLRTIYLQK